MSTLPQQIDLDGRLHDVAPQHERLRLFAPAPPQLAGQTHLDTDHEEEHVTMQSDIERRAREEIDPDYDPAAEPDDDFQYSPWRHGGWYVDNVRYPSGAVGCVSRNFPDRKWRIACDERPGDHTYATRDDAARAERDLIAAGVLGAGKVWCPNCGGETFQEFGRTGYSQELLVKRAEGGKIVIEDDNPICPGGYGDRTDYPEGDEPEGVECRACLQSIEVEGAAGGDGAHAVVRGALPMQLVARIVSNLQGGDADADQALLAEVADALGVPYTPSDERG